MNFYIVIPAHNEQEAIGYTLDSLVNQTHLPKKVVVVNDNSSDATESIIKTYTTNYEWITLINNQSSDQHNPGAKIIEAFYRGYETLDENYDIICKYDADLIFPDNYLETISELFKKDNTIGIAGGLPYIKKNGQWVFENIASKNHVRGPLKAYRKACFFEIGGLKSTIGWDSIDVFQAKYKGWKVTTDKKLHVKHLKPTGYNYNTENKYLQGEALYKMRLGFSLSFLITLKNAFKKRRLSFFYNTINGFLTAKKNKVNYAISKEEGEFARKSRWKNIFNF